jgi:kynurenine formamidase
MTQGNWGRWGADDERGALNILTPDVVRASAASVRTGKVYSLGIPVQDTETPILKYRGQSKRFTLQDSTDEERYRRAGAAVGTGFHEDMILMSSHATSHLDALVHVYGDYKHYNGVSHETMHARSGAGKLGVENIGGFASRGVLLDMVRYYDEGNWVTLGHRITAQDLQGCASQQGTEPRAGDIVLIRTGYLDFWRQNYPNREPVEQAGITSDAGEWLASLDVVAVGSDNAAVEVVPFEESDFLHVHKILLVRYGIYLMEFLDMAEPAADRAYEGILAVSPLKITGATGSPVNPLFIT